MTGLAARFAALDVTAVCDADKSVRVLSGLVPRSANARVVGPAFTVRTRGDILPVLRAIEAANPGDVVVVDGGGLDVALGGEMFVRGAQNRGLAGFLVDGAWRDIAWVASAALPVYSRSTCPAAGTSQNPGELQVPVVCGGVAVRPGDLVVADEEGVVVIDPALAESVVAGAEQVKVVEARLAALLDGGGHLSDGTNLAEHLAARERGEPSALRFTA